MTLVLAEVKTCPNGWDPDNCYDSGRGLNPCGTDAQHCQGDGTSLEVIRPSQNGYERMITMLDTIECDCGPDDWTVRVVGGDPSTAGTSVWACPLCQELKSYAIIVGWGSCETVTG